MYVYRRRALETTQLILDCLSFWPIWKISTHFRIILDPFTKRQLTVEQAAGWVPPMGLVMLLSLLVWWRLKLFAAPKDINAFSVVGWATENSLIIIGVTVLATFFSHTFGTGASRAFVLCLVPVTLIILTTTRCLVLAVVAFLQRGSLPRIALVGDFNSSQRLILQMESKIKNAILGVILPEGTAMPGPRESPEVLGTTSQLAELVNSKKLDRVIVINGSLPQAELAHVNKVFWKMGLPVSSTLSMAAVAGGNSKAWAVDSRVELSNLNGLRVVDMRPIALAPAENIGKRAFDFVASALLLLLTLPILIVIAVLVKLSSKGPVLEKAPRVGMGGRHFTCLKFRTTYEDLNLPAVPRDWNSPESTEDDAHHSTPLGRFLRRCCLDELPQLINILAGEMSLVGPRPLPAHHLGPDGMSKKFGSWSEARARVRPGLTGLWQIAGRSGSSFGDMIRLDLEYVNNRSFFLDGRIILATPLAVIRGICG